jgi:hypothetical protein
MEKELELSHEEIFIGGQLLDAKLKCLELSIEINANMGTDADTVVDSARKFFDFITEEIE